MALLMDPDNECLQYEYRITWNALQCAEALLRCSLCHTTKWGRRLNDPCLVCKCRVGYRLGQVQE